MYIFYVSLAANVVGFLVTQTIKTSSASFLYLYRPTYLLDWNGLFFLKFVINLINKIKILANERLSCNKIGRIVCQVKNLNCASSNHVILHQNFQNERNLVSNTKLIAPTLSLNGKTPFFMKGRFSVKLGLITNAKYFQQYQHSAWKTNPSHLIFTRTNEIVFCRIERAKGSTFRV